MMDDALIHPFGGDAAPVLPADRDPAKALLGGKGANLIDMAAIGLPVPPGFVVPTHQCRAYDDAGRELPKALLAAIADGITHIEGATGRTFGRGPDPLLVSVRSGARVSMPGMMDTVLNLGLNDETVEHLAIAAGDERFAWDSYRRFIQMYADVVLRVDQGLFEEALEIAKEERDLTLDTGLDADALRALVADYRAIVLAETGSEFPQNPVQQLHGAVAAVFDSWRSDRATVYRRLNAIPADWGTAVTVQAMVFGNMGETSATGVAFTRDPATGERAWFGEWLANAQGEDVVAGIRTPQYLTTAARERAGARPAAMEEAMPDAFADLARLFAVLEAHYRDMQDIEFTVERGRLWLLQTRSGKRTAKAAMRIATEMVAEGLITPDEAVTRIDPAALDQLLHPTLDPAAPRDVLARGLPASPGAASGVVALDADTAERLAADGQAVILVRHETSPEDIHGMAAARGILTARGGMTSHAAVVARGMGRPCVSGAAGLIIDAAAGTLRIGGRTFSASDFITIDGTTGEVMAGRVPTSEPEVSGDFATIMGWADASRRMRVRANAETPADARLAREFGAEGIGLCRTEHMFFDPARILAVRQMILAEDADGRRVALEQLLPAQRADFAAIFTEMAGWPVTIRLLDPPLHEFLPTRDEDFADVAAATGLTVDSLRRRAAELAEHNPMLGHRGCRLGITFPDIYAMQARAIFEAALDVARGGGDAPVPEIMIPLAMTANELSILKALIDRTADDVFAERGMRVAYLVGTMIELPRAALVADTLANHAAFFSFGTNDLTQTTLGISRDDAARFLGHYVGSGVLSADPFVTIDVDGVGHLVRFAAEAGRVARPDIKLGICGEHGGDPASIAFCESVGLHYVSASPYRVPVARLAAAQAAIRAKGVASPGTRS